ncbi:Uncharacterized protein FWK35_00017915 [Aphis craccivora]|uniref:Uncharacterized protein n=1 Tax=Aphis craccivora TaxID=307492 RepID=A0A6G0Y6P7_APHCR|nr:Uncharacterized protein FWK35_00017915 [Aphis craccivora]
MRLLEILPNLNLEEPEINIVGRSILLDTPNSDQSSPELLIELPAHNLSCNSLNETFDTDEIMAHNLETENSSSNDTIISNILERRRIVDINVFEQIQSIRHNKFDCSFLDMVFQHECRRGYRCKMCNFESTIHSERTVQSNKEFSLGINTAIVNGSSAIDNTYNLLFKFNLYNIYVYQTDGTGEQPYATSTMVGMDASWVAGQPPMANTASPSAWQLTSGLGRRLGTRQGPTHLGH